jgi:hypothetical protein
MGPFEIGGALTAMHHSIAALKGILEGVKASGKAEAQAALIELQSAMLEIQTKYQDLVLQNAELHVKIKELEEWTKISGELTFDGEVYWKGKPPENSKDDLYPTPSPEVGPFCQPCLDKDRKLVRLQLGNYPGIKWACAVCNSFVYLPGGRRNLMPTRKS